MAIQNSDYKSEEIISQSKSNPQNWKKFFNVPEFDDPNVKNLVAKVSTDKPILYTPKPMKILNWVKMVNQLESLLLMLG